jgi:hypothetical protein
LLEQPATPHGSYPSQLLHPQGRCSEQQSLKPRHQCDHHLQLEPQSPLSHLHDGEHGGTQPM